MYVLIVFLVTMVMGSWALVDQSRRGNRTGQRLMVACLVLAVVCFALIVLVEWISG